MNSDINHIIQQSLKGDKNCQEILLKKLNPLIFKNIYKYIEPKNSLTEDLLQEGYIVILQSLKDFDKMHNAHFLYYVKIKLYYFYKNYFRKHWRYKSVSFENIKIGKRKIKKLKSLEDIIILNEEKNCLYSCIRKLSKKEQSIIMLYYFDNFSMKEISRKLNITYKSTISIKNMALKKLKSEILRATLSE